jgi:hypothetical protein
MDRTKKVQIMTNHYVRRGIRAAQKADKIQKIEKFKYFYSE